MDVICLRCAKLDLRTYPAHSAVGFGKCSADPLPGVFVNLEMERTCTDYTEADADVIEKRVKWRARK